MAKKTTTAKKRVVKVEATGEAHISSTFNNVIIALTNNVVSGVLRRTLLMLLRSLLKMLLRQRSMLASAK